MIKGMIRLMDHAFLLGLCKGIHIGRNAAQSVREQIFQLPGLACGGEDDRDSGREFYLMNH